MYACTPSLLGSHLLAHTPRSSQIAEHQTEIPALYRKFPLAIIHMVKVKVTQRVTQRVQLFANPWTIQSMEFFRSEHWSG